MSRYARDKGKQGERDLADWMGRVSGVKYRRVPMSGALHLDWPGDVMKMDYKKDSIFDNVLPENKNTNTLSVPAWIAQAEGSAKDANLSYWFICFKHNAKHYFVLPENYYESLLKKAQRNENITN